MAEQLTRYSFYIEGLGREAFAIATSQKEARAMVWNALTVEERDRVETLDWVDTTPVASAEGR